MQKLPSIVKKEEGQNSVSAQELTMHGSVTKDKPDVSCTSVDEHPGSSSTANGVSIIHSYLSKQSNVIWRERRWYVPQHERLSHTHTHTHTHTPRCLCVTSLHHMNASPSEKNMKTVLVLLLAALLSLSEAEYRRTVSYEGEVVVRWYVSSAIVTTACRRNFDHFV